MGRQRSAQSNSRKIDDQPLDKSSESAYLFFLCQSLSPKIVYGIEKRIPKLGLKNKCCNLGAM